MRRATTKKPDSQVHVNVGGAEESIKFVTNLMQQHMDMMQQMNTQMAQAMSTVLTAVQELGKREIEVSIPEIKMPEMKMPSTRRPPRNVKLEFTRDGDSITGAEFTITDRK